MEVNVLNQPPVSRSQSESGQRTEPKSGKNNNQTRPAATFVRTEITVETSVYRLEQVRSYEIPVEETQIDQPVDTAEVARLREMIHQEIMQQVKDSLGQFFLDNPDAAEQVSRGEIPEYFNAENTARRILNIYFSNYQEGEDRTAFVERARGIIEQAYGEVTEMVGSLPEIVQSTRQLVMDMLDRFEQGGDISDFLGYTLGSSAGE